MTYGCNRNQRLKLPEPFECPTDMFDSYAITSIDIVEPYDLGPVRADTGEHSFR